jgi:hypothetical protein
MAWMLAAVVFSAALLLVVLASVAVMLVVFRQLSGWQRLAARYPAPGLPTTQLRRLQTVRMGAVRYRNCTTVALEPDGLYIDVPAALLMARKPILIPWSEITGVSKSILYLQPAVTLAAGEPRAGSLTVYRGLYELMRPYLAGVGRAGMTLGEG